MRRVLPLLLIAVTAVACTSSKDRALSRYYDPEGLFVASLPAGNVITVAPPQVGQSPGMLSGVISEPVTPSPSPATQGGLGQGLGATAPADQTVYEVFAVSTDVFDGLSDMALYFLTGEPTIDVREQAPIRIDGAPGRLVVADSVQDGEPSASLAVAMTLGTEGTGYIVAAIFPPGGWDAERADFLRVVDAFRTDVPPGLGTFPVTQQDA